RFYESVLADSDPTVVAAGESAMEGKLDVPGRSVQETFAPKEGWMPLTVTVTATTLACEGGRLEIKSGSLTVAMRFECETEDDRTLITAWLKLTDSEGRRWESRSLLSLEAFTDFIENEGCRRKLEQAGGFLAWVDAPTE